MTKIQSDPASTAKLSPQHDGLNGGDRAAAAYEFGAFRLDVPAHQLLHDGEPIPLTPKAFEMLLVLVRNRHRVVSKDDLLGAVWPNSFVTEDSLTQNIWHLRRALSDDSAQPAFISTIPRTGYRFVAEVIEVPLRPPVQMADSEDEPPARDAPVSFERTSQGAARATWRWNAITWVMFSAMVVSIAFGLSRARPTTVSSAPVVPVQFTQGPPDGTLLLPGVALSPDGRMLAFVAQNVSSRVSRLWIRSVESGEVRPLEGTEGAEQPFWSPASNALGFFADGQLKTVDLLGTRPQTLATVGVLPQGGSWSNGDVIIFAPWMAGLYAVPAAGGEVAPVTTLDRANEERGHRRPQFLPDGQHFLFNVQSVNPMRGGTYIGALQESTRALLLDATFSAVSFVPPDRVLSLRDTALMAGRLDVSRRALAMEPVKVPGRVVPRGFVPRAGLSASAADILAFGGGPTGERLVSYTRDGTMAGALDSMPNVNPALSPDRKQLATTGRDSQAGVWLVDLERGASTRIIPDGNWPTWSPDGTRLAFSANRVGGIADIYMRAMTGRTEEQLLLHTNESKVANDWSPDGQYIVFVSTNPQMKQDLWLLPMFGERKAVPYLQTRSSQIQAQVSPDGRWLAYASDESGRWEVYMQSFPTQGNKRTISVGGGGEPKWRDDGRELFYIRADKTLMSVTIDGGDPAKGVGTPQPLFAAPVAGDTSTYRSRYAVMANGNRFLFNVQDERNQMPITVIVNWTSLLD